MKNEDHIRPPCITVYDTEIYHRNTVTCKHRRTSPHTVVCDYAYLMWEDQEVYFMGQFPGENSLLKIFRNIL